MAKNNSLHTVCLNIKQSNKKLVEAKNCKAKMNIQHCTIYELRTLAFSQDEL